MKITPDALVDDGLFDVLMVKPLSRFNFLRIFPRVFAGTHVTDPRVRIECARKVRIEAEVDEFDAGKLVVGSAVAIAAEGYGDARTLERRAQAMEAWLAKPELLEADKDAEYAAVIEIDLADIKEPIVCCPNDPDDAKFLSEVAGTKIDEAFIGSCMTNIGHFRAAGKLLEGKKDIPVRLWVAPPTKMDATELTKEGFYNTFGQAGARTEMPGCSLCMGNQAQIKEGSTCISTSTRNFPNRLGKNTNVFLGSAELTAVASKLGKLPTPAEYMAEIGVVAKDADNVYKYMNFNQIEEYVETAKGVKAA